MRTQQEIFDKAIADQEKSSHALMDYWGHYSNPATWQFWVVLAIIIVPLIVVYFKLDRRKVFLISFFGYSMHMFFAYMDVAGIHSGFWSYRYQVIPVLPNLPTDSSLVPVTFMLVYQWTLNQKKNYYLYAILTALIFAFVLKPILVYTGIFTMYHGVTYIHLFIVYFAALIAAKLLTDLFISLSHQASGH
ncbi:hypothetical protein EWI07_07820 [Sporolactobacillus sp. THM7-4]|nr:hypothetical protein EWI07_07820 [Sporolactobacillus sp. THM7-4]